MVKQKHETLIHFIKKISYTTILLGARTSKIFINRSNQAPQAVAAEVVAVWQVNGFVAACVLQHNFPEVVHDFA